MRSTNRSLKMLVTLLFLAVAFFATNTFAAWVNQQIRLPGDFNAWNTNTYMSTNTLGSMQIWSITLKASNTGAGTFLFENWGWWNKWNDVVTYNNKIANYTFHASSAGTDNTNKSGWVPGEYYTFRLWDQGYASTKGVVLHTTASPISITSVADNSGGSANMALPVKVHITLSAGKSTEERIYVRYTTNWLDPGADVFQLAVMSNLTGYTCSIPAINKIKTIYYYILSTTTNWAFGNDLDNQPDLMTLRLNNNGGANYSYVTFSTQLPFKVIDGQASDWHGTASTKPDTAAVSSNEWIWTDKLNDERPDFDTNNLGNYDLSEARVTFDSSNAYFLFKLRDITDIAKPYLAISISTDAATSHVGMNWMADDSGILIGGNYGKMPASGHYGHFNVIVHDNGASVTKIELYKNTGSGNAWYAPPTLGQDAVYINPTGNLVEFKIARQDIGLSGSKTARISVTLCKNIPSWANSGDSTYSYFTCDAVDSVSLPPLNVSDNNNTLSAWSEGISTGLIDYFTELRINALGQITNAAPQAVSSCSPTNGSTNVSLTPNLKWNAVNTGEPVVSYLLELSSITDLSDSVLLRVNVTNTNYQVSTALPDGLTYYWRVSTRGRAGVKTPSALFSFSSIETQTIPAPTTAPFTPVLDGQKDAGWGSTPYCTSPAFSQPVNDDEGFYAVNDADYMYVGFPMHADPINETASAGYDKSAHYGFVIESKSDPVGGLNDPFIANGGTKVQWTLAPDFWIEGWIKTGYATFGKLIKYNWSTANNAWAESPLVQGSDFGCVTNQWAEFRISLSELAVTTGKKVNLLSYFRPADDVPGVSDSAPYDSACNNNGTSASILTSKIIYKIQYAMVNAWHAPATEDVSGFGTMREPLSPSSVDVINVYAGIYPYTGYDSASVIFTTNNWSTSETGLMTFFQRSANNAYVRSQIGPFRKGLMCKYIVAVSRNGMVTYVYGTDQASSKTASLSTAKSGAFEFVSGNSAPPTPAITLSPAYIASNSTLIAAVSSVTDADADPITCYFQWYKNGQPQTNLKSTVSVQPFISRISNVLSIGDNWYCSARLFDGKVYSGQGVSAFAGILMNHWSSFAGSWSGSSIVSNNEFVWFDPKADTRDDTVIAEPENFDLSEVHFKTDATYLYALFKFNNLTRPYGQGIAISINTDANASIGISSMGPQMNLSLGSNYSGSFAKRSSHVGLIFHSLMVGSPGVEMQKAGDFSWSTLASSNAKFAIYPDAGYGEAKIRRDQIGLTGNKTGRLSIATFMDKVGPASMIDASLPLPGNDAVDIAGVAVSRGTNLVNYALSPAVTAWEEGLARNTLDFWMDVSMDMTNTAPIRVTNHSPTNNGAVTLLKPLLQWGQVAGSTGYYLELGRTTNFELYKVDLSTNAFTPPVNLPYAYTNYLWRVRARNTAGVLSPNAYTRTFRVNSSSPQAGSVSFDANIDNYGKISSTEDSDGKLVLTWPKAIDVTGISNYYLCVGTNAGGVDVINNLQLLSNRTSYTTAVLPAGKTYYAKVKAKNKQGITGAYGENGSGIFVSKISIDAANSDWMNPIVSPNRTRITNGAGIWQDALADSRNFSTNVDLDKFKVVCDKDNLYLYFSFNSIKPWADGQHYIQVAIKNDDLSITRPFLGRGISGADLFTSADACWDYLVKIISGVSPSVDVCDQNFNNGQKGVAKENTGSSFIECAIPLSKIGGASKFLNNTVRFSVAVFQNNAGNITAIDGDSTPDALDVVATNSGSLATWNAISSQVLDSYLEAGIAADGSINSFSIKSPAHTAAPVYASSGSGSAGWIQNAIIYFMFIDRFYNGDTANDVKGSTKRKGGDLKGILDNLSYLQGLNINTVYLAPPQGFGEGGAAGYNTSDWWNVDSHFGTEADFRNFVQTMKNNGIDVIIDWPGTAIGGGPTVDNNNHWAGLYNSPWGGWPEWTVGMAEVQQFFSDTLAHWSAKGVRGFRMDYAKFDGNPVDHGHQYWQYVRSHLKAKFPDRYMFGEVFDSAYKISSYTWAGDQLDGCFDFPLEDYGPGGIIRWGITQDLDSGSLWNNIQGYESTYGNSPTMISFIDNHDKDRALLRAGGDSYKIRLTGGFTMTWHEPTSFFYGTEMGMNGYRDGGDLDNSPCIEKMWGLNPDVTPWWGGYNYAQYNYFKRLISGRRSFPSLRTGKIGVNVKYASGQWLIYERNYYSDTALVILNRGSAGAYAPCGSGSSDISTWTSRTWRDWMNGSDYFYTGSDGKFTGGVYVAGNDCRILISRSDGGGYGECTISGTVNVPGATVRVKDYAGTIYERVTTADKNGNYQLNNVVCKDVGNEDRPLEVWASGFGQQNTTVTIWDGGTINANVTLVQDVTPPSAPIGLSIRAGDKLNDLRWAKNSESDMGSYVIYRSENKDDGYVKVGEVLDSFFIDNTSVNGTTYYYKLRAKDLNGNYSAYGVPAKCVSGPIQAIFWLNVNGSGLSGVQRALILGNSEKMNFWGGIGDDPVMTEMGNGLYRISFAMDARLGIMYKYKVLDSAGWHEESSFSGTGSWYGARYLDLSDQGGKQMNKFDKWNAIGTPSPVRVQGLSLSPGNSQISLSWTFNPENNIGSYLIYRASGGTFSNVAQVEPDRNKFTDRMLNNGTTYSYYIVAVGQDSMISENSKTNKGVPQLTDTIPPSKPQSLQIYATGTNRTALFWSAGLEPDLAGYNIYRSNAGAWQRLNASFITAISNPSYYDQVIPGLYYKYRITAVDFNANESSNSSVVDASVQPVEFRVDMGNIPVQTVSIGGTPMHKESGSTWMVRLGLIPGQTLQYKYLYNGSIYEHDFAAWHKNREIRLGTNLTSYVVSDDWESQPDVPQNVWAFPKDKQAEVHWDAVSSADLSGYNVYYSTNATGQFVNKANTVPVAGTSITVSGLQNGKTYYFVVRAVDSGDIVLESPDSAIVTAVPVAAVPVYFRGSLDREPPDGFKMGMR